MTGEKTALTVVNAPLTGVGAIMTDNNETMLTVNAVIKHKDKISQNVKDLICYNDNITA